MIIGLTGEMGSGKSTLARELVKLGKVDTIMSFAKPVKLIAGVMLGKSVAEINADKDRELPPSLQLDTPSMGKLITHRHLLQFIGTDLFRDNFHPDIWVMIAASLLEVDGGAKSVVFDDVRFENEAAFIRSRGGIVFQIVRPGNAKGCPAAKHSSEEIAFQPDYKLINNGTISQLIEKFVNLI